MRRIGAVRNCRRFAAAHGDDARSFAQNALTVYRIGIGARRVTDTRMIVEAVLFIAKDAEADAVSVAGFDIDRGRFRPIGSAGPGFAFPRCTGGGQGQYGGKNGRVPECFRDYEPFSLWISGAPQPDCCSDTSCGAEGGARQLKNACSATVA